MRTWNRSRLALGLGALLGALALAAASPGDARADRDGHHRHGRECRHGHAHGYGHGYGHGRHGGFAYRPARVRVVAHRVHPRAYRVPVAYWWPAPPPPAWGAAIALPRPYVSWSFGF
jgi:hypothetical protein